MKSEMRSMTGWHVCQVLPPLNYMGIIYQEIVHQNSNLSLTSIYQYILDNRAASSQINAAIQSPLRSLTIAVAKGVVHFKL
jgi:hypothetical protein